MKIFSWMRRRMTGRHEHKKPNSSSAHNDHVLQEPSTEEFGDWPHALLAIGTLGSSSSKEGQPAKSKSINLQEPPFSSQDLTLEEVGKFLSTISSLEAADQETDNQHLMNKDSSTSTVVLSGGKDISLENGSSAIGKKSLCYLLKKMLVCRSGLATSRGLRDPIPESHMEKILRAILHNKIYPQSSCPRSTTRKYLPNKGMPKSGYQDGTSDEVSNNGSKWVKTDSEYIVLEI